MHIAVQTCVITALRDVPTKLFTFRFCLIHSACVPSTTASRRGPTVTCSSPSSPTSSCRSFARGCARTVFPFVTRTRQLDHATAPELRPRKRRQTQVNGCRIHREQLGFEPVAMSRRLRLAAPQQSPVQLLVHLPRLLGVHPRERRPRHHADPQVVELARLCGKIRDDVPQAAASCQLRHPHRHELAPAGHAPRHPTRLVLACEALELMSRYELEYLREYGVIVGHGLGSPCVFGRFLQTHHTSTGCARPVLIWL